MFDRFPALAQTLAAAALSLAAAAPGRAEGIAEILAADFLPGWRTDQGSYMTAVRVRLAPGWKTYWRSPGDAGVPPEFGWDGSHNIRDVHFHWPRPDVFQFNGMQTIGYARELVLPVEIWPVDADRPVQVATRMDMGVCRDICVPASVEFTAELPPAGGGGDPVIRSALRNRPETKREAGVRNVACSIAALPGGLRLTAEIEMPRIGPEETVVVETSDPRVWVSEPAVSRQGTRVVAVSDLVSHSRKPFLLDRSAVTITVLAKGRAVELHGCPAR